MSFLSQTLPVALAVFLALSLALAFARSVLHLLFGAMRRIATAHQIDAPAE
jgi:hypothetical protein